ncbi:MAG: glutaredoxin domain-containing protein [Rhizobiaceae bacterium]|nr:glutaredoxin domain-containing protein [Rhizobiaceae bacterium]
MSVKQATLFRMVMSGHLCPSGLKAKDLLERHGFSIDDNHLENREQTDAFKNEHSVKTTPQIWIDGERIGGYNDLLAHFGEETAKEGEKTYRPVIAIFSVAALMAFAFSYQFVGSFFSVKAFEWFIAISVCFLAVQKLQDIEKFSTMFLSYDLLARRWLGYGKVYPFLEALGGVLMLTGSFTGIAAPLMLFIGGIGAVSVFKAVYIDKRDLNCACVGGDSNVPLGFVSLTENLMMVAMGIWMFAKII